MDIQLDNRLSEKAMALKVDQHAKWCENLKVTEYLIHQEYPWKPLYGEKKFNRRQIQHSTYRVSKRRYNRFIKLKWRSGLIMKALLSITTFRKMKKCTYYRIVNENTKFSLPEGTEFWHAS